MTDAVTRVKTLIQDMAEDRQHYHELAALLTQQREHIIARRAPELDAVNEQIMDIYQRLAGNSRQRFQLLSGLGVSPGAQGMQTLLSRLPGSHQARVTSLWNNLEQQAAHCRAANEYNGTLMNMQQEILVNLLNVSTPENWLYQQG